MTWLPENQRDTSWYIFNQKFRCSVPYIDMRSADHIRLFGTPTSGVKEIDLEASRERVETYLSINQMVEYYRRGALVGVKRVADTKVIYERIMDHLNAWKNQLQYGLNNADAPIDDLLLLDQFANAVYAHAKHHFKEEITDSLILRQFANVLPYSREGLIASMEKAQLKKEGKIEKLKEIENKEKPRQSMANFFSVYQHSSTLKPSKWD